jgi:hypothetical protein
MKLENNFVSISAAFVLAWLGCPPAPAQFGPTISAPASALPATQTIADFHFEAPRPEPPLGGTPPILVPSDVTNPGFTGIRDPGSRAADGLTGGLGILTPLSGIRQLPDDKFVGLSAHSPEDGVYIRAGKDARFDQMNPDMVKLHTGQILIAVSHPSKSALVQTYLGDISVQAEGQVLVSFDNGLLRVKNLIGQGNRVTIRLDKGPFAGPADPVYAISTGYELTAGNRKVTLADLHPADGIGRRGIHLLAKGYLAISQISLTSVLSASDLLVDMAQQTTGAKERRLLSDLSKMAAVLNYVNGTTGYVAQRKTP